MKLFKIEAGNFKLDGGSMFGVVPKSLWNRVYPADENNMCNLATRCLLIQEDEKLILIDTGLGNKQSEKFFSYYFLNGADSIEKSLHAHGFNPDDITDVILTHLHFDHCGGAVRKDEKDNFSISFPNANYMVSRKHWNWAMNPNQREKASFLIKNIKPIEESGKLKLLNDSVAFSDNIKLRIYDGHTEGLLIPFIKYLNHTLVFVSDLFPTAAHISASWLCGFDTQPLVSIQEHTSFLEEAADNNYILFFEHDIYRECCTVKRTEKGIQMKKAFPLSEL